LQTGLTSGAIDPTSVTEVGSGFQMFAMLLTLGLGPCLNLGELLK
jgi:hypothetical protein